MPSTTAKRSKREDKRPARARYWQLKKLEKHKVAALVKHNGMDRALATVFWRKVRKRRIKE